MTKLFRGLLGALALSAIACSGHAAPRAEAPALSTPVSIAVFHPDEIVAGVQTVQYRRHYYHRHYRRHYHHHYYRR